MDLVLATAGTEAMARIRVTRAAVVAAVVTAAVPAALYWVHKVKALEAEAVLGRHFQVACPQVLHMFLHQDRQEAILIQMVTQKLKYMLITY